MEFDGVCTFALGYFAWQILMAIAYSVDLSDEGVAMFQRNFFWPGQRSTPPTRVGWHKMRKVRSSQGMVTIEINDVWNWMYLTYNQARVILDDPRCPLRGKVPDKAARAIGLRTTN